MKREWDTIRLVLTELENKKAGQADLKLQHFDVNEMNKAHELSYNVRLLIEQGLVVGKIQPFNIPSSAPPEFYLTRLTSAGHDLLETIRNETVWSKTKESFASKGLDMTIDTVKAVATAYVTSMLGLS